MAAAHVPPGWDQKLSTERRKAARQGLLVDTFLIAYGLFAVVLLLKHSGILPEPGSLQWGIVPAALGLAFLWGKLGRTVGCGLIERSHPVLKHNLEPTHTPWWRRSDGLFGLGLLLLTIVLGWVLTEIEPRALVSKSGLKGAGRLFSALFQPDWSILPIVLEKMVETIFIALMATVIAVPAAFVLSFFCARNLMRDTARGRWVYSVLRLVANFSRSVEPLVWAIIFSVWVGIGPFAGMLALMIHSIASLIKLYSEQIENVDQGPLEAIEATGANRVQVVWHAVVPQILLPYLSFTIYRWDINIRMATVIGLVGGGGIGNLIVQYQGLAQWRQVGTIVIVIAVVVWFMDYLSARLREAIY